tara:strand:- start:5950 stop:7395 length:1446 start_codon:yes stop_codon:yes gene_type:complete
MKFLLLLLISINTYAFDQTKRFVAHKTDKRFLSFALDTALLVGSYWWNESGEAEGGRGRHKIAPFDILNPLFIKRTSALAPAYFRVGGSEADALFYAIKEENPQFDSQLTKEKINELKTFIQKTKLDLFFTLNAGPLHWKDKTYASANVKLLIDYFKQIELPAVYEFGNEVLAYWAIWGINKQISTKEYSHAFAKVRDENQIKLAGAASAFWPVIGEPMGFLFGKVTSIIKKLKRKMDIITWHYYPVQSSRCPVAIRRANLSRFFDAKTFDAIIPFAKEMHEYHHNYAPSSELWMGETGSAQCGGMKGLSDTFLSSLWWADELATLALYKHDIVIRQSIVGGDYALLDFKSLKPRPDYWLSLLWKKLMGQRVIRLPFQNSGKLLRIYQHCHPEKGSTSLIINASKYIREEVFQNDVKVYQLTSPQLDKSLYLNQKLVKTTKDLDSYMLGSKIKLPPRSISFIHNERDQFCSIEGMPSRHAF